MNINRKTHLTLRTPLAAGIAAALSFGAQAQTLALEEVVVTAQKRTQSLQDVPISVSAISGDKMVESQITNLESLTTFVPNFSMNQSGISNNITIRGVSSGINPGFEQSTGMYVDDIYYGRGQLARSPLFDLERIEVLRGPQPILFGKNSIAGAVSIVTAKPSDELEGSVTAYYESEENTIDTRVVLSGPLSDTLSGRISALFRETDGSYVNTLTGDDEKQEEESVIRAQLRWEPNDNLSANFKYETADFDDFGRNVEIDQSIAREDLPAGTPGYAAILAGTVAAGNAAFGAAGLPLIPFGGEDAKLDRRRGGNSDYHTNESEVMVLNVDYAIGDYTLSSTTGWLDYSFFQDCDCDFTSALIFQAYGDENFEQFSQEIRLTSPGGEQLDYIVGAFYQTNELDFNDAIDVPTASLLRLLNPAFSNIRTRRFAQQDSDLWAVFGQVTWNISDSARLILGGRYTEEDKTATKTQIHFAGDIASEVGFPAVDPSGATPNVLWALNPLFGAFNIEPYDTIRGSRTEKEFTPQVTFQWDVNDQAMAYVSYVEGFKAGGFDIRSNGHPDPSLVNAQNLGRGLDIVGVFEFEDEAATSYEVGLKTGIGDTAEVNIAYFYTEYENLQTSQFDGVLGFNVTNAGAAEISGLEADARWLIAEGLTLTAAGAFLDFEYTDFRNNQVYFGMTADVFGEANLVNADGVTYNATGKRKEYTPEFTASLSLEYVKPLANGLELRTVYDVNYSDDYIFNPTLDPRSVQDAYTLHNIRVGVGAADGGWEVAFIGKNLTDEDVVTYGGEAPLSGALTGGTAMGYYKFLDKPATYAVQGTYRF